MQAKFYFSNSTYTTDILTDSFQSTEIYYNKLQPADSSLSFTIPFSTDLCNKINADINKDVKVEIKNDDGTTNYTTAYVKKEIGLEQKYRNQPIAITAVNPSYLLDQTLSESYALENKTVSWILEWLLEKAGFDDVGTLNIPTVIPLFVINSGENIKDVIRELCFEYSKTFYFDNNGFFQVYDLFTTWSENTQTFSKENSYGAINITAKEHDADCVRGKWTPVEYVQDTLVFQDSQGATEEDDCSIAIGPHQYFAGKQDNLLDCDSKLGSVLYVKNITQAVIKKDTGIVISSSFEKRTKLSQIYFSALNENEETSYITKLEFYADAYISKDERTEVTSYGKKEKEITLKYIQDETIAQTFVKNIADYYNYANFIIELKSKEDWNLGSFCQVIADGIGSFNCRILKKTRTLKSDLIKYELENIGYYLPAEIVESTAVSQVKNMAGSNQGTAGANGYNCFTVDLFKRYSVSPAVPADTLTYDFTTGELSGNLGGWSRSIPEVDEDNNPCYEIHYNIATVSTTKQITANDWSIPVQILKDSNLTLADVQELISQSAPPPTVYINPSFTGFAVDSASKVTVDQSIDCVVKVVQTDEEMPFTFGDIVVPNGFFYSVDGNTLTLGARAGTLVNYGSITIPVKFRAYKAAIAYTNGSNYLYIPSGNIIGDCDEVTEVEALTPAENDIMNWIGSTSAASETLVDGGTLKENTAYIYKGGIWKIFDFSPYGYFTYEDEDSVYNIGLGYTQVKGGRNLGTISSASDIPSVVLVNDYFVWGGASNSQYNKGAVYAWNGTEWRLDESTEHNATLFFDIMGIASDELAENNSTASQMLDHLTANEVFAKKIVSNEAFISELMADEALINTIKSNSVQANQLVIGNIEGLEDALDGLAGKNEAIISTVQVYYLTNGSKPAKPTTEVISTSTAVNTWTTVIPSYTDGYTYYSCSQYNYADGTFGWSTVKSDPVLNSEISALESANTASNAASNAQESEQNASASAESASGSASSAQGYSEAAQGYSQTAESKASDAADSASSAAGSAETAEGYASSAGSSAEASASSAGASAQSASAASDYAQSASDSAGASAGSASTAQGYSESAYNYKQEASNSAGAASSAKSAAETAQGKAETAQTKAETAQGKAETAKTAAETAQAKAEEAQGKAETAEANAKTASTNTIVSSRVLYYRSTTTTTPVALTNETHDQIVTGDVSNQWTSAYPSFATRDGTDDGLMCLYWTCTEYTKHNYTTGADYYQYSDPSEDNDISKNYYISRGLTVVKGRYIDTGLIEAESIKAAMVDFLDVFAQKIKLNQYTDESGTLHEGVIYGGDRWNEDGSNKNENANGFYMGTDGLLKCNKGQFTDVEVSGTIKGNDGYFKGVLGSILGTSEKIEGEIYGHDYSHKLSLLNNNKENKNEFAFIVSNTGFPYLLGFLNLGYYNDSKKGINYVIADGIVYDDYTYIYKDDYSINEKGITIYTTSYSFTVFTIRFY